MIHLSFSGKKPHGLREEDVREAVHATFLRCRKKPNGVVAVVFLSTKEMTALNRKWRGKNRATDVLSFSALSTPSPIQGVAGRPSEEKEWGDLFLCSSVIRDEAKRRSIDLREELLRDCVHGVLHLFGYDHATEEDELKMFTLQEEILANVLSRV